MKRHNRTLALLLVLLAASFPLAARAAGNPTVTYTGDQTAFTISDVGDGSATDLFAGFKGVMPGDVLTQRIDVRNESGAAVRIYLRQEPVDEAHRAFLQQLRLTVTSDLGGAQLYEAPPAEQDGLAENVLLGLFYPGAKLTLTAQLTVPAEMDNAFADLRGTVRWVFTVEEDEAAEPDTPAPGPATGDAADPLPGRIGAAVLAAASAALLVLRRAGGELDLFHKAVLVGLWAAAVLYFYWTLGSRTFLYHWDYVNYILKQYHAEAAFAQSTGAGFRFLLDSITED